MIRKQSKNLFPEFHFPTVLYDRPFDIITLGNAMLEMIISVSEWPGAGGQHDQPIPLPTYSAGGCATNVACFAGRFGGNVAMIGRLGDGRYSQPIMEEYYRSGVDTAYIRQLPNTEGNLLIIMTNPDGDWSVLSYMDPNLELTVADLPDNELFQKSKVLHIDGFTLFADHQKRAVEQAMVQAREAGCLISIDASVPMAESQPDYLAKLFARSDIVFANRFESLAATKTTKVEEAIHIFQKVGSKLCFLKMGAEGSYVVTPQNIGHVPAYEVEVVDMVAAGDAYIAASLLNLCQGVSLFDSAQRGSAAGALACLGVGSLSAWFTMEEIEALIAHRQS